jgi:hypothetical protein
MELCNTDGQGRLRRVTQGEDVVCQYCHDSTVSAAALTLGTMQHVNILDTAHSDARGYHQYEDMSKTRPIKVPGLLVT